MSTDRREANTITKRTPRTQIVAIGAHGTVENETLRQRFDRCRAEPTKIVLSKRFVLTNTGHFETPNQKRVT
jgi:hypothetical protein